MDGIAEQSALVVDSGSMLADPATVPGQAAVQLSLW
jgi:hypothetical protein